MCFCCCFLGLRHFDLKNPCGLGKLILTLYIGAWFHLTFMSEVKKFEHDFRSCWCSLYRMSHTSARSQSASTDGNGL